MAALALKQVFERTQFALMLLALYGAIAIFLYERSSQRMGKAIEGYASVVDGDTILIADKRIRLFNIDAPEFDQTCGEDRSKLWFCGESAAEELKKHLAGQRIHCEARGYDHYRRVLASCTLPDGSDINAWTVREGWALDAGLGETYKREETEARLAKRGIWSSQFITPSEWRAQGHHDNSLRNGD